MEYQASESSVPRYVIASLVRTCYACPSQYEGKLVDGRVFYMRYRWGMLSARVAARDEDLFTSDDTVVFCETVGNGFDGLMDEKELVDKLSHLFDFKALEKGYTS